jgi:hypothetical protein
MHESVWQRCHERLKAGSGPITPHEEAILLARHPRAGSSSLLRSLPSDIFRTVYKNCADAPAVLPCYESAAVRADRFADVPVDDPSRALRRNPEGELVYGRNPSNGEWLRPVEVNGSMYRDAKVCLPCMLLPVCTRLLGV